MTEPFYFGIPLIARASATDWPLVEQLFALTLRSILAQKDADFRVILAAHEQPRPWIDMADDPRFVFLQAEWSPEPPTIANDDGGRKKWMVKQHVRQEGGGLLMFLDADDWVRRDLVRRCRETILPEHWGAVIGAGFALDYESGRVTPFPISDAFPGEFHQLCGSSTIARLASMDDASSPDPYATLGSHHEWVETGASNGIPLARIDIAGLYMIGTGENHSERDGPVTQWRREITATVRSQGAPFDRELAAQFGQDLTGQWRRPGGANGDLASYPAG